MRSSALLTVFEAIMKGFLRYNNLVAYSLSFHIVNFVDTKMKTYPCLQVMLLSAMQSSMSWNLLPRRKKRKRKRNQTMSLKELRKQGHNPRLVAPGETTWLSSLLT